MRIDDTWDSGLPYEPFMGRWSRRIAPLFLDWLQPEKNLRWLDVGCGTGALSSLIARKTKPFEVLGIDPSAAFVDFANRAAQDMGQLHFQVAGAEKIPANEHYFDIVVSALALNFFPDPVTGLREMGRVLKPGKEVALYVWDYAEGMQMLRYFWDAVVSFDPSACKLDEKNRFPICKPLALQAVFQEAGFDVSDVSGLEADILFASFDDYWQPFLGGAGPAPGYVNSLGQEQQVALALSLKAALPVQLDGTIPLRARAWAIKGKVGNKK